MVCLGSGILARMATRTAKAGEVDRSVGNRPVARMRDRLDSKRSSRLLAALAEPARLRIIQCLERGPNTVGEVGRAIGFSMANTSHHLQYLRQAGLVQSQRRGRHIEYSLTAGLFRPPVGDSAPAFDFGSCRVELSGECEKPGAGARGAAKTGAAGAKAVANGRARAKGGPHVEGVWVGEWEPSGAAKASTERGPGRKEIVCIVKPCDGGWQATFEGDSGGAYKFVLLLQGRRVGAGAGSAILFKGSTDLGAENGGVFDCVGRATAEQFVGFYTSARYTGVFSLAKKQG